MNDAVTTAVRLWTQSKRRMIAMAIGLAALLVYEAAQAYYRPYVYAHGIDDFHIADTLGNSLGTVATAFFFVSLLGTTELKGLFFLRVSVIAVTVYELSHPLLGKPVDAWDILATLITGGLLELLYRSLPHEPSEPQS